MTLDTKQVTWLNEFAGMRAVKDAFDRDLALKAAILADVRRQVVEQRDALRNAMTFNVEIDGEEIGRMLADDGTQLDEVDFMELQMSATNLSLERTALIAAATGTIAALNERLKAAKSQNKDRLFTDQEIADELWTPLVRERLLPETTVANKFSETQQMLDATNQLYQQKIAEKKAAGELNEKNDLLSEGLGTGSKLAKIGSNLASALGGPDASLAKDVLDLCSVALETSGEVYDIVRKSDFPNAADTVIDNIGAILTTVVTLSVDKETGDRVGNAYKAITSLGKVGVVLAQKGSDGVNEALGILADGIDAAFEDINPKGENADLFAASKSASLALRNAGSGYAIGAKLAAGDTKGAVDELTKAAKNELSTILAIKTEYASVGKSKEQREDISEESESRQKSVEEIIDWSAAGLKTIVNTYDNAKKKEIGASINSILEGISGQLESVLTRAGVSDDTAKLIANAYDSSTKVPKIIAALVQDPPDKEEAAKALGEGLEKALSAAAPDNTELARTGKALNAAFFTAAQLIEVEEKYKEGKYGEVVAALTEAAKNAAEKVFEQVKEERTEDLKGQEKTDVGEEVDEQGKAVGEGLQQIGDAVKGLAALKETSVAEVAVNLRKQEEEEALAEAKASADKMKHLLQTGGESGGAAIDASAIDRLIEEMIRDRLILETAAKISQSGFGVAAKFCPALEMANSAIKLATNIYAAAERAMAMHAWMKNTEDFSRAQNALTSASQNFVKNQKEQFSHYTIQAALQAVKLIAEAISCSGLATAAGQAISKSASAASEAVILLETFYKKVELERAWTITCEAFNNPSNRKLGLRARALNPTLAKYTIAWGAMEKNDPLAKNAMASCGLTETSLANETANVDKVVKYLELYFQDDDKLYRELESTADWLPEITLAITTWSAVKTRAKEKIELSNTDTGNLDGHLATLSLLARKFGSTLDDLASAADETTLPELVVLCEDIRVELSRYKPQATGGANIMKSVLKIMDGQAADLGRNADRRRSELRNSEPSLL